MGWKVLAGAVAGWCLFALPAQAAQMTASEIRASLVGQELCTPKSGGLFADMTFCFTYGSDGTFRFKQADAGQAANWAFDKDQICLFKLSNPKDKSCASFERTGDKRFKVNGKDDVCLGACAD